GGVGAKEAAIQTLVGEGDVLRPVILEMPAERLLEEALGGLDIARWIFDIVDLFVQRHAGVLRLADDGSQPSSGCLCEGIARRWIRGPAAMARHESPGRRDQGCSAQRS